MQAIPQVQLSPEERKLCKIYKKLDSANRHTLLSFADFLGNQLEVNQVTSENVLPTTPLDIPRSEKESVIKAIKRLSATYPMLDKDQLFDKISSLMTEHIIAGREANSVIDELEQLFSDKYKELENG